MVWIVEFGMDAVNRMLTRFLIRLRFAGNDFHVNQEGSFQGPPEFLLFGNGETGMKTFGVFKIGNGLSFGKL